MKRYIKSSVAYPNRMTYGRGSTKFSVYYTDPSDFGDMQASISEIHPYDDADYAYAKIDGLKVTFYRDGRQLDTMHLWSYEPDDYENITEYINDIVDAVCAELRDINKDVKPRMMYD